MIRMMGLINLQAVGSAPIGARTMYEEELKGDQKNLDVDGDGQIEDEDLAKLRAQKNEVGWSDDGYDSARDRGYNRKKNYYPWAAKKPVQQSPTTPTLAPTSGTAQGVLGQVVRYKDIDGKDREATVKSLLSYPKEHPGRKIAARMYAQYMTTQRQRQGQLKETIVEENPDNPTPSNDHEVSMARNSLEAIIRDATELMDKIGQEEKDIPAWIQDHITNAANFLSQSANNYHEHNTSDTAPSTQEVDLEEERKTGETWKTKSGKTATKNSDGSITYTSDTQTGKITGAHPSNFPAHTRKPQGKFDMPDWTKKKKYQSKF